MSNLAQVFHQNFIQSMDAAGLSPRQMLQHVWKPYELDSLSMTGPDRDLSLDKLRLEEPDIERVLAESRMTRQPLSLDDLRSRKLALVLVPGYTHETLRNLSWHEEMDRENSPHQVVLLHPGADGGPTREEIRSRGNGLRMAYAKYPRSNAASRHINEPLFRLLHDSPSLRSWVEDDGYRLLLVGYSYGAPLGLELLSDLNTGRFNDRFLLEATSGFLALCGDIGGAYLADEVLKPDSRLVYIQKVIDLARRWKWFAAIAGLGTRQLRDDMFDGVTSLGHQERQSRMRDYAPKLPADKHYFSIGAVCPLADYRRHFWQFNFDDWSMYRQALISDPISVYNDGQVVLEDNLLPSADHIPAEHIHHLGAVRTHHWGVSYRTFNLGRNRFPRRLFHGAVLKTLFDSGMTL